MKINRLMPAVFVSGCVCVALPALASSPPSAHPSSPTGVSRLPGPQLPGPQLPGPQLPEPQCGDDDDDGDGDGDEGDDGDDDGGETRTLEL